MSSISNCCGLQAQLLRASVDGPYRASPSRCSAKKNALTPGRQLKVRLAASPRSYDWRMPWQRAWLHMHGRPRQGFKFTTWPFFKNSTGSTAAAARRPRRLRRLRLPVLSGEYGPGKLSDAKGQADSSQPLRCGPDCQCWVATRTVRRPEQVEWSKGNADSGIYRTDSGIYRTNSGKSQQITRVNF